MRTMDEHRAIWLEPSCVAKSGEDRHWCHDDPWGACEECGTKSVKYIIATEHEALVKALGDALCELSACSVQMNCKSGGSVVRAIEAARQTLEFVACPKR